MATSEASLSSSRPARLSLIDRLTNLWTSPGAFFYGATYLFGSTWERPGDTALADAPIDPQRLLHAEEEVTFPGPPPRAGDELTGRVRLESVTEKTSRSTGRTLRSVTATTEFRDSDGAPAATSRTTAVEELAE